MFNDHANVFGFLMPTIRKRLESSLKGVLVSLTLAQAKTKSFCGKGKGVKRHITTAAQYVLLAHTHVSLLRFPHGCDVMGA